MIYTVTLNPALDYTVSAENFTLGETNRTSNEHISFGGKGLNVSAQLVRLGIDSIALGFSGGFVGQKIIALAKENGCECDFVEAEGQNSRINIKIKSSEETELNGKGPEISRETLGLLYSKFSDVKFGDTVVLSGSVPKNVPLTVYTDIMMRLPDGVRVIVDAGGVLLKNTLKCRPFLVKPNASELGDLYGTDIAVKSDAVYYGKRLAAEGAENVLVSLGEMGAVLISGEDVYEMNAPGGNLVDSVGAGDAMVAGFIYEYERTQSVAAAFKYAVYTGSAAAFSNGFPEKEEIERLIDIGI